MVFHRIDPKPIRQRVLLIPADAGKPIQSLDIEAGFKSYNATIAALWGDVVAVRLPAILSLGQRLRLSVDLWIDDEGMLRETPALNARASALAGRVLAGDCMAMCTRSGAAITMPAEVEAAIMEVIKPPTDGGFLIVDPR